MNTEIYLPFINDNINHKKEKTTKTKRSIVTIKKSQVWSSSGSYSESPSSEKVKMGKYANMEREERFENRNMLSFNAYTSEEDKKKGKFQEDEKIPEKIEGTYTYDYDISLIDEIIIKKFEQDKKNKLSILKNKSEIENTKILGRQNYIERQNSKKQIEEIEDEIFKYTNDISKNKYIEKSKSVLNKYLKMGAINNFVSFVTNNKEDETILPEKEEKQFLRHRIISEYLEIARKYITINLVRKLADKTTCPGCDIKYEEIELIEDESGSMICPNCSVEKINIVKKPFYSDGCRVNNSRNNYEDKINFEKVLLRYQGKQVTKPGKELYEKIDEYFLSRGLPTSKDYKKIPLLEDGTKEGTSREMMYEALSNINCSGYYDDINLILHIFFGWSLPDVTHLEDTIMKDYEQSQKEYDSLNKEGRKSSLNSQFRLYCLLRKNGVNCKFRDFKIPSTPSILEYHKNIWKQICENSNWEYFF
jgi:Poxvirus Late Transcription Factor VLTF3 like